MICIATFFSHFGAIRFKKYCESVNWQAKVMPVPRDLSSSCGTCVKYEGNCPSVIPEEAEQIVAVTSEGYQILFRAENS